MSGRRTRFPLSRATPTICWAEHRDTDGKHRTKTCERTPGAEAPFSLTVRGPGEEAGAQPQRSADHFFGLCFAFCSPDSCFLDPYDMPARVGPRRTRHGSRPFVHARVQKGGSFASLPSYYQRASNCTFWITRLFKGCVTAPRFSCLSSVMVT